MDLRKLVERLQGREENNVVAFENKRVVRRTHATLYEDVQVARAALEGWGVRPGDRVGLYGSNCYQWLVYELAMIELRAVSAAFTDDFADKSPEQLSEEYSLSLLLVRAPKEPDPARASFVAYIDGENEGVEALERGTPPVDEDFECPALIFSSGSSGGIKGMSLNRKGIALSVAGMSQAIGPQGDDCVLLFLPMSNFQQRLIYYSALWYGTDLIVTDPSRLFRALTELRPTILVAPPTLYEAVGTRFFNLPKAKRWAARAAGEAVRRLPGPALRAKLARSIFKDVYALFGGRMRFMVTGMAPIKRSTLELFATMQLPLFETYGLVECGSLALNVPGAHKIGSVGRPLAGVEFELAEDGEIIVHREHMVATGYFQCAEGENEKTFIGANRIATGDVGRLDKDGFLYLVGRKKEIIITAGGEKVHPEAVESEIGACPYVARSVVFGGPGAPSLVAIILPTDPQDPDTRGRIEHFVEGITKRRASMSVGRIVFTEREFTRENGFLRPNLKLDRRKIAEYFRDELSEIDA